MNVAGFNGGYGYTKLYTPDQTVVFPSIIGYPEHIRYQAGLLQNGKPKASVNQIQLNTPDGIRFVGQLAADQSRLKWAPQNRSRVEQETMKLLLLAAFSEAGLSGQVKLVTGLPVKWYSDKQKLIDNLRGTHALQRLGQKKATILIQDVVVLPEPFGTIYSQILTPGGKLRNKKLLEAKIAVIDIGMHTTDFVFCDAMTYIEAKSSSIETGMSKVYRLVSQTVEERLGLTLDLHQADEAVRAGSVRVQGKPRKITTMIGPILAGVAEEVLATTSTLWGDGLDIDILFITGGGATSIGPQLAEPFPQLSIVKDSQMANAEGYYNYGVLKWNK